MKTKDCSQYFEKIQHEIHINSAKLVELDQAFGDGDLGISMDQGFTAVNEFVKNCKEEDFGKFFMKISKVFNESAPSSLGTILSFGLMGMAKRLNGIENATLNDFQEAFIAGVDNIKEKTGAKLKDKTIIDSLEPAVSAFGRSDNLKEALHFASEAAKNGMEETTKLIAVHGRAAYHKEKTLGHIDGGAYVSYVIFKAIAND